MTQCSVRLIAKFLKIPLLATWTAPRGAARQLGVFLFLHVYFQSLQWLMEEGHNSGRLQRNRLILTRSAAFFHDFASISKSQKSTYWLKFEAVSVEIQH